MGRTPLLKSQPEIQENLARYLSAGLTVSDACAMDDIAIDESTFHRWQQRGRDALSKQYETGKMPRSEVIYVEFFKTVMRARARARAGATGTIVSAIKGNKTVVTTTQTFSETRLNKFTGETYLYEQVTIKETVTDHPGDWRAALEYLKRQDPANWSADINVRVTDWHHEVVEYIKRGDIAYEVLAEEMGGDLATELFAAAGIPVESAKQE